ncbi:MAG: ATP-binding cassette domain-containing protein [Candidatus Malihini olakiniferum]
MVEDCDAVPPQGRGALNVDILAFSYPQQSRPVLERIKFMLSSGNMLGLCGPTGSGKSTLLALILCHFNLKDGEIRFHGHPLAMLNLDSLRQRFAVVGQTPFLFSDTVANNIALGKPDATLAQIQHAARLASIHDDITRLRQGYGNASWGARCDAFWWSKTSHCHFTSFVAGSGDSGP